LTTQPITYRCVAGTLIPKQRWLFDRTFVDGQEYELAIHEPRSTNSHNHYFAAVREAWKNLPEKLSKRYPDPEHLRKWSLIKCGWVIERTVVCGTEAVAAEVAALAARLDESAVVTIYGTTVIIGTARSQKTTGNDAMNKEEFQKSKQAVLEYIAGLIGVDVATLSAQVSNSSEGAARPDRTDTPAAESGPHPTAAGVTHSEVSVLSDDWRDVYIQNLAGVRDKAASLLTRHTDAIQMIGGEPNAAELAWMRMAWRLVQKRNEDKLKRGEYDAELQKLKTMPLPAAQDAA
jgi:hypothetical protein